ncbi:hypothetical protein ACXR2U_22440 [Jatrophihabitans sp. YIM 134969]
MSRSSRLAVLTAPVLLLLTACGGSGGGGAAEPSVASTQSQLQDQLDALPQVDGAQRTSQTYAGGTLTEAFTVPAGSPACLQLLAVLDAGGYQVVAGTDQAVVSPTTCRTPSGAGVGPSAGTATILAAGGSEIALTWTTSGYTIALAAS